MALLALACLGLLALGILLALDAGYLKSPLVRYIASQTSRSIQVRGALRVHLLTRNPRFEAEQVTIGNPAWTKPGTAAVISKLVVVFSPLFSHPSGLAQLTIDDAQLTLSRDMEGHANWQRANPDNSSGGSLPIVRDLQVTHTHLRLTDDLRHLDYDGNLSVDGPDANRPILIEGTGKLNEHDATFVIKGQALRSAIPNKPYSFEFDERSTGAQLSVHGTLPQALDLKLIEAEFTAHGNDLRDLYFLAGVNLPNTGIFEAEGRITREGELTRFENLKVHSGETEIHGRLAFVSPKGDRTQLDAQLESSQLRLKDIGLRAAGRDPHPDAPPKMFSDIAVITAATRRMDMHGALKVHKLLLTRIELDEVSAPFSVVRGHIESADTTARLLGGQASVSLKANANEEMADVHLAASLSGIQLAQLPHKSATAPYEGSLSLQAQIHGHGNSLHDVARTADGKVNMRISQGMLRAALAELVGIDLRGLGLVLVHSDRQVPMPCAAADFAVKAGTMQATDFIIDTEPVLITGVGSILLGSETLDLTLRGTPKKTRIFHLKAPILVRGSLLQPEYSVGLSESERRLLERGTASAPPCSQAPLTSPGAFKADS